MISADTLPPPSAASDTELTRRVADFLYREADLLDTGRYEDWAALFTADCLYWLPVDPAASHPDRCLSHIRDDRQLLDARVHRLHHPRGNAPEPIPRTVHMVTNVRAWAAEAGTEGGPAGEIAATCTLLVSEFRPRGYVDDRRLFAGRAVYRLLDGPDGLRIREKRVDLVDSLASFNAIIVPI
ncbi:MAG: hypothetical protein RLY86_2047 [Pseudomonadota bacterium]|jgi:benzoate/toluate 1,2-dioxygenase beta subunit